MNGTKKIATLAIFILICVLRLPPFTYTNAEITIQSSDNTPPLGALVVPDQYSTIQAAIGNATAGDTVFVKEGIYLTFNLEINKPIQLIGQTPKKTILDGGGYINVNRETIVISSSNVRISGFTIVNSHEAIVTRSSNQLKGIIISGNYIINSSLGIRASNTILITENSILNNDFGIEMSSAGSVISSNVITNNRRGISIDGADNLTISGNIIANNSFGVSLNLVSNVDIYCNNITGSLGFDRVENRYKSGIVFNGYCNNSLVHDNIIGQNSNGIDLTNILLVGATSNINLPQGYGNLIYRNNFLNNTYNGNVEHSYPWLDAYQELKNLYKDVTSNINGTAIVSWDNGTVGNYWSDYQIKYPNATEVDASGIGDTVYVIDENNVDYHPLMHQVKITVDEQPPMQSSRIHILSIVAVVIILIVLISLIIIKKKKLINKR